MESAEVVIFVTAPDTGQAEAISRSLLEEKLIACANIVSGVRSLFWWEGKIDSADEVLLVLKSRRSLLGAITERVRALHSYDVPEVIALPIEGGNPDYLRWVRDAATGPA